MTWYVPEAQAKLGIWDRLYFPRRDKVCILNTSFPTLSSSAPYTSLSCSKRCFEKRAVWGWWGRESSLPPSLSRWSPSLSLFLYSFFFLTQSLLSMVFMLLLQPAGQELRIGRVLHLWIRQPGGFHHSGVLGCPITRSRGWLQKQGLPSCFITLSVHSKGLCHLWEDVFFDLEVCRINTVVGEI